MPPLQRRFALSLLLGLRPWADAAVEPAAPAPAGKYDVRPSAPGVKLATEVYKRVGGVELTINIYRPARAAPGPVPAIVFFPGGGWQNTHLGQFSAQAQFFVQQGMIGLVADYRVKSRHGTTPFESVQDAKSALRWVRTHAAALGVDPHRLVASGGSAGGHLAAACAVIDGLDDPGDDLGVSPIPDALVLFNPVYDNSPTGYGADRIGSRWQEISPLHHLRPGMPPAIVFIGDQDHFVPAATAKLFQAKMRALQVRSDLVLYAGAGHGFFNYRPENTRYFDDTMAKARAFLSSLGYFDTSHGPGRTVPGLGLELRPIPAGNFLMGSPPGEPGRGANEGPPTRVALTRAFWLGTYAVTVGQWKALMGTDLVAQARLVLADDTRYDFGGKNVTVRDLYHKERDSHPESMLGNVGDNLPMYWVNWEEAVAFCRKLTERERAAGRLPVGYVYRLPTEAEWEYAGRAGTTGPTYAGDFVIRGESNAPALDPIAWYGGNSSVGYTGQGWDTASLPDKQYPGGKAGPREVGTRFPNAWGLHDVLGDVFEWCGDRYLDRLPGGSVSDPRGPETGSDRVVRGGSWQSPARKVRLAFRGNDEPGKRHRNIGFRVALAPP